MSERPSYLKAAFNARPLGMPIPPNWFGLAAFGLLGALVNPGLWLIGLGLEGLYLWTLSRNPRFRNVVDASATGASSAPSASSLACVTRTPAPARASRSPASPITTTCRVPRRARREAVVSAEVSTSDA